MIDDKKSYTLDGLLKKVHYEEGKRIEEDEFE